MPISIKIKGNNETLEYKDALMLKNYFEKEFFKSNIDGEILIINSATLFGQETKDIDLIVLGNFANYKIKAKTRTVAVINKNKVERDIEEKSVYINNFCFVIETKKHRAEDIRLNGTQLLVKYNNYYHDVTTQSERQKYALFEYIKDRLGFSPFICNFIWFRNINWESIKQLLGNNNNILTKHNYLPDNFSIPFLFQLAFVQKLPYISNDGKGNFNNYSSFNCLKYKEVFDIDKVYSIFELFNNVKNGVGNLTRKKIEMITSKLLDNQQYAKALGNKFVVLSGRAGTGKTIKLLRIASDLAIQKGGRCLILTYNNALVSDIRRILALAGVPDGLDSYTVNISTLHKFFYELIIGFEITQSKTIPDYFTNYDKYLNKLYDCINEGLIVDKDIQDLMSSRHDKVAWDYVLIDEAQDWNEQEKAIILKMFGKNKVVIADGIDQLIRTQKKCNWTGGMTKEIDYIKRTERQGLRQEVNLVSFVNSVAKELNVEWAIEPKQELIGGKIIITTKGYDKKLHFDEVKRCKDYGNTEYEMMFLVPPRLVNVNKDENGRELSREFRLKEEFAIQGIKIWDGTSKDLRTEYPVDLSQHRLMQYESCRGLEGWTVVCLELDEFVNYKMNTFIEEDTGELALESFKEKRNRYVYLWSLIPLTRAIDTLVITLRNKNSKIAQSLYKVYKDNPDFIQWIE